MSDGMHITHAILAFAFLYAFVRSIENKSMFGAGVFGISAILQYLMAAFG